MKGFRTWFSCHYCHHYTCIVIINVRLSFFWANYVTQFMALSFFSTISGPIWLLMIECHQSNFFCYMQLNICWWQDKNNFHFFCATAIQLLLHNFRACHFAQHNFSQLKMIWFSFQQQNKIVQTKENLNLNWVQGVHLFCIKVAALPNLFLQFPPNFLQIFHKLSRERHHLPHHPPNPCLVITTVEKFMLSINFPISFLLYSNSIQNRCQK